MQRRLFWASMALALTAVQTAPAATPAHPAPARTAPVRPAPAHPATVIDDPAKFVTAVYARLAKGGDYIPPEDIYTARLKALWDLEEREAGGEVGRIDFLFWINGQDGTPSVLKVKTDPVDGRADRKIVEVSFVNDKPQTEQFYFEKVAGHWKLDDVTCTSPGESWTLSVILKYGWPG